MGGAIVFYPALATCASEFSEGCVPAKKGAAGRSCPFAGRGGTVLLSGLHRPTAICEAIILCEGYVREVAYGFDCAAVDSSYMGGSSFLSFFMFRHPAALGDAWSSNAEELVLSNYDLAEHRRGLFEAFWDFRRHLSV